MATSMQTWFLSVVGVGSLLIALYLGNGVDNPGPSAATLPHRSEPSARVHSGMGPRQDAIGDQRRVDQSQVIVAAQAPGSSSDLEAVLALVAALPDSEVAKWVGLFGGYEPTEIGNIRDVRAFAATYAHLAMTTVPTRAIEGDPEPALVSFSNFIGLDSNRATYSQGEFGAETLKIYAGFQLDPKEHERVVARCFREGDDTPLVVRRSDVATETLDSYVWFLPSEGWKPGTYHVELLDEFDLHLVSEGRFVIAAGETSGERK